MPGFVETDRDEKLWSEAKRQARKSSKTKNFYALANYIFHKKKGK